MCDSCLLSAFLLLLQNGWVSPLTIDWAACRVVQGTSSWPLPHWMAYVFPKTPNSLFLLFLTGFYLLTGFSFPSNCLQTFFFSCWSSALCACQCRAQNSIQGSTRGQHPLAASWVGLIGVLLCNACVVLMCCLLLFVGGSSLVVVIYGILFNPLLPI